MSGEVHSQLKPVRFRQQARFVLQAAALGLLAGSCLAILVALARIFWIEVPVTAPLVTALAGLVAGTVAGLVMRVSWMQAARSIDRHYRLKDRTATALHFVENPRPDELRQLQIADALVHLGRVRPGEVAPLAVPRSLPYAIIALVAAVVLVLAPLGRERAEANVADPLPGIVQEAELLEETMIPELEALAAREQDKQLEKLVEELKELVEQMKEPGVDLRQALAKLSQMQAAIAEAQAEFNLEAVDASLKELGEALSPAAAMTAAAAALQEGKYSEAADQLDEFDGSKVDRKEAKTVAEQLKKLAKKMQEAGQGQLSQATSELCEGLESDSQSQCKGGACKLAGLARKQGLRKSIGQCLGSQLTALGECKSNCQGNCQGNKNGGQKVAKSDSPKNTWGLGASGQPVSDQATKIEATLNREQLTGTQGDGPSEKEVTHSPEGREQASREYREKYQQYRRMSEAVLESEPLPLGHRQTIRKYFESIRPENDAQAEPADGPQ